MSKHKGGAPVNPRSKRYQMMKAKEKKLAEGIEKQDARAEGFKARMDALRERAIKEDKIIVSIGNRGMQLMSAEELAQRGITPKTHILQKNVFAGTFTPVPRSMKQSITAGGVSIDSMLGLKEYRGFEVVDLFLPVKKGVKKR
ncbi:MAG: hypothetical protein V1911_01700 [Candidatus Micrarchaeota archaeon]